MDSAKSSDVARPLDGNSIQRLTANVTVQDDPICIDQTMEKKLQQLITANSESDRLKWALEWKKQGKKVIGIMSSYVPEEVITAAGMLPWRITGAWRENISRARAYRSESSCGYCNHVLESFLSGEFDFLDGIVIADIDQDLFRLWDVLTALKKAPFTFALHIPFVDSELNYRYFAGEIRRLIAGLEEFGGVTITDDVLRNAIESHNRMRRLLSQVYEWRKRENPPLSGAEILGLTTAAQVMPRDEFANELEALLPQLSQRKTKLKHLHPRLLILSDMLDQPDYIKLVEENCLVAMDDLDTGIRYFINEVDTGLDDLAYAMAKRFISRHGAARMAAWDEQFDQIVRWVKEYKIDGVLGLPLEWCYPERFRWPLLSRKLDAEGIPNKSFERDYHLANVGQLRTRIGAFLEMLSVAPEKAAAVTLGGGERHV